MSIPSPRIIESDFVMEGEFRSIEPKVQCCWHKNVSEANDEGIAFCFDCEKDVQRYDSALYLLESERQEHDRGKPWKCLCGEDHAYYEIKCTNCGRWRM